MNNPLISIADLRSLGASLSGTLVTAADHEYDDARALWNAMIDRRPELIIRAGELTDIPLALDFARSHHLPLAVRGGGHNVAGHGTVDRGLVLDLRACNKIMVNPSLRQVSTGPGTLLGELDQATSAHGLAVPVGVISRTGIAGLCLGGGFGWLTRAHGLTVDNLIAAEMYTPSGEKVRADARENPELLWGLRGGGGNFGIVADFTFSAHTLPETVLAGNLIYRAAHWRGALHALRDWAANLPDAMTVIATALVPPEEWELGTDTILAVGFVWADPDHAAGSACVERFTELAPPDVQDVAAISWPEWQSSMDDVFPKGVRAYWKNTGFDSLDDDTIALLVDKATQLTWPGTAFDLHVMGGAMGRVAEEATAFPDRSSAFWINIYGFWKEQAQDAHHREFIRGFHRDMSAVAEGGEYLNFSSTDAPTTGGFDALAVYGEQKYARLAALKRRYDPHNELRLNHNIKVTG
ncbi:FAD-binding oxidoreductase [Glutamicibacter soli]|uniref:FAD-binding oxidoreductase n=1 Tax=Glutamicibacter soli TaxID=453836 RepID=UPI003F01EEEA